jgi:hypothetical protein
LPGFDSLFDTAGRLFVLYEEHQHRDFGEAVIDLFEKPIPDYPETVYSLSFNMDAALNKRIRQLIEQNIPFNAQQSATWLAELKQQIASAKEILEKKYAYLGGLSMIEIRELLNNFLSRPITLKKI